MKRFRSIVLLVALLGASVWVQFRPGDWIESVRETLFDSYQRLQPRPVPADPVVIVDIDEASLARLGQWPWPRHMIAHIVTELRAAGASAVAFDVVFPEPDRTSPEQLLLHLPPDPALARLLAGRPTHDGRFAEAIAGGGVVTGFGLLNRPTADRPPVKKPILSTVPDDAAGGDGLPAYRGAVVNLPELDAAADGVGAIVMAASQDKVMRSVPTVLRLGDALYPSLSVETFRLAFGGVVRVYVADASGLPVVDAIAIGGTRVATERQGYMRLHYSRHDPSRYVSAADVLGGRTPRLDGRIVFVGTSATGLKDIVFTPHNQQVAGVEVHAQAVEQMRDGTWLVRPFSGWMNELLATVVLALAVYAGAATLRPAWAAALGAACVLGVAAASWFAFAEHRLLFDPILPAATLVALYLAVSLERHLATEGERRFIRRAFQSYVSPNLVRHLLSHRGELALGGERRECSFVMTDLAGFTPLIEKADAEQVVAWLNQYLDGMIAVAFRHEGTLDRIVGDAVAVMFSAPVRQDDHRARALACALEMDVFARSFRQARRAEGVAWGATRIGVHAGEVIVGNFGGQSIYDYRALGDPINTAARLESVNKQFGTLMAVSQAIVDGAPAFRGRPIGDLVLKGKTAPIRAWEPLSEAAMQAPATAAYLAAFEALAAAQPAAADGFARVLDLAPDDSLARYHADRLARGGRGTTIVLDEK